MAAPHDARRPVADLAADRMDLNRVKFLLRAYLRVRLAKVTAACTVQQGAGCSLTAAHAPQIEEHVLHIIASEGGSLLARLSTQEQEFAKGCVLWRARVDARASRPACACRYTDVVEEHFRASVLHALPPQYDSIVKQIEDGDDSTSYDMSAWLYARFLRAVLSDPRAIVSGPNLNSHVFCRVKEDKGNVEIDECAPARALHQRGTRLTRACA